VFPIVAKYARQTVLVTDEAIANAQAMLWRALRIVAEPGGAAAFSAILSSAYRPAAGERVAIVISGGNTAAVNFDLTR
jgi:threonine dehydratase